MNPVEGGTGPDSGSVTVVAPASSQRLAADPIIKNQLMQREAETVFWAQQNQGLDLTIAFGDVPGSLQKHAVVDSCRADHENQKRVVAGGARQTDHLKTIGGNIDSRFFPDFTGNRLCRIFTRFDVAARERQAAWVWRGGATTAQQRDEAVRGGHRNQADRYWVW